MFYPKLTFPTEQSSRASRTREGRPFFYTNFVMTLDGKVAVSKGGYWPIGSRVDYKVLIELRAHADALIHGKNLSNEFGSVTQKSLNKPSFKKMRRKLGKNPILPYIVAGHNLKELLINLHDKGYKNVLVEGGPTILGSFLKEDLIDEIFLTIVPKIYGTENLTTKNLVEGILFPPDRTKKLKLLSIRKIKDELFLRYKLA